MSPAVRLRFASVVGALSVSFLSFASASVDSSAVDSAEVLRVVEVSRKATPLGAVADSLGRLSLSGRDLRRGLHVLGEADAVRSLCALPGYQSVSDYASGIVVGGDDYTVTSYSVDGAQVFYPFHFAGVFSTFNPNYFASVRVSPPAASLAAPFMLGANIEARSSQFVPSQVTGGASVGILATGASVAVPLARQRLALRGAIRLAHPPPMSFDDTSVHYDFTDANLSARYVFSDTRSLAWSASLNSDNLDFSAIDNAVDSRLRWKNLVNALSFSESGSRVSYSVNAYISHFQSSLNSYLAPVSLVLDSDIDKVALSAEVSLLPSGWELGFRCEHSSIQPMRPVVSGMASGGAVVGGRSDALMGVGAARSWRMGGCALRASARCAYYRAGDSHFMALDPQLSVSFPWHGQWRISIGHYSQFQHLVGLSDFGFASDFWLPSDMGLKPQRQWGIDFSYASSISRAISLSAKGFVKRVLNSAQYMGSIFEVIDVGYDPFLSAVSTNGYNVGGDVVLAFDHGAFSGFGGYSLALCRRRVPFSGTWTSSATEPLHSFKASLTYRPKELLNLSAFFTLSSGRPYTPINAVYIIAGNVITDYGILNSARLPLYHRLDLSATYTFGDIRIGKERIRNFINFSIINVLRHRNVELQYFRYHESLDAISLKQVSSLYRFLPSISYTIEF